MVMAKKTKKKKAEEGKGIPGMGNGMYKGMKVKMPACLSTPVRLHHWFIGKRVWNPGLVRKGFEHQREGLEIYNLSRPFFICHSVLSLSRKIKSGGK